MVCWRLQQEDSWGTSIEGQQGIAEWLFILNQKNDEALVHQLLSEKNSEFSFPWYLF